MAVIAGSTVYTKCDLLLAYPCWINHIFTPLSVGGVPYPQISDEDLITAVLYSEPPALPPNVRGTMDTVYCILYCLIRVLTH